MPLFLRLSPIVLAISSSSGIGTAAANDVGEVALCVLAAMLPKQFPVATDEVPLFLILRTSLGFDCSESDPLAVCTALPTCRTTVDGASAGAGIELDGPAANCRGDGSSILLGAAGVD